DLPAIVFDDLGGVFRERIDLGLGQVLTREENMLVERHVSSSLFWPIADVPPWHAPPAVVLKSTGAAAGPCASGAPMTERGEKRKAPMNFALLAAHRQISASTVGATMPHCSFQARKERHNDCIVE